MKSFYYNKYHSQLQEIPCQDALHEDRHCFKGYFKQHCQLWVKHTLKVDTE